MGAEDGFFFMAGEPPEPDDPALAWDAAERHAVALLWQGLPEVRSVPAPAEVTGAARRIRSSIRKWPYKQLARAAWGRARLPAGDTELWLDAAGAPAAMRLYPGADPPLLEPASVLRPADWVGAVIGVVHRGPGAPVSAGDLARYARECAETTDQRDGPDGQAYDPFASIARDDRSLERAFASVLVLWEAVGAVDQQWWLTRVGWWGLPRALARAWNGDFDAAGAAGGAEQDLPEGTWPGREPAPEDLGIHRPPLWMGASALPGSAARPRRDETTCPVAPRTGPGSRGRGGLTPRLLGGGA